MPPHQQIFRWLIRKIPMRRKSFLQCIEGLGSELHAQSQVLVMRKIYFPVQFTFLTASAANAVQGLTKSSWKKNISSPFPKLNEIERNWTELNGIERNWTELNGIERNRTELNKFEQNWAELNRIGQNWTFDKI